MNPKILTLILASVSLSALAQIALKSGMSSTAVTQTLKTELGAGAVYAAIGHPHVLLGLLLYATGAFLWLWVLANLDVSMAYPFVGLGFILTMLFGFFFLGEPLGIARVAGTLLVLAGVVLISHS